MLLTADFDITSNDTLSHSGQDLNQDGMDTEKERLDAQFDRAVAIVQDLPKDGIINMEYEEKLRMYGYVALVILAPVRSWR